MGNKSTLARGPKMGGSPLWKKLFFVARLPNFPPVFHRAGSLSLSQILKRLDTTYHTPQETPGLALPLKLWRQTPPLDPAHACPSETLPTGWAPSSTADHGPRWPTRRGRSRRRRASKSSRLGHGRWRSAREEQRIFRFMRKPPSSRQLPLAGCVS